MILKRIPSVAPREMDLSSIVARLNALEDVYTAVRTDVNNNTTDICTLKHTGVLYSDAVRPSNRTHQAASNVREMQTGASSVQQQPVNNADRTVSSHGNATSEGTDQSESSTYRGKRPGRKERLSRRAENDRGRRKPTFGTNNDSSQLGGKRTRDLFIYNVNPTATPDAVVDYIKSQNDSINIAIGDVVVQSKDNAQTKSFRISVDSSHFDIINSNDFWPSSIAYRPFFHKRSQRKADTDNTRS